MAARPQYSRLGYYEHRHLQKRKCHVGHVLLLKEARHNDKIADDGKARQKGNRCEIGHIALAELPRSGPTGLNTALFKILVHRHHPVVLNLEKGNPGLEHSEGMMAKVMIR